MNRFTWFVLIALMVLSLPALAADKPVRVVASFSILADMAASIGGDDVSVTSLVAPNRDAHTYEPTPEDAKALAHADIVLINGLGFEGWIERLVQASGSKAKITIASQGVTTRTMDATGAIDPHAWQDIANGRLYAKNIAMAFEQALPGEAVVIAARASRYDTELAKIDRHVRAQFADIPAAQRKIITSHDAFGYFGAAYGVTFLAPVGLNTEAEPSASDVVKLIGQIKSEGIKQLFLENMTNPKLIEQIGKDTGAEMGGTLYSDALSAADGPAPTYLDIFRNNVPKLRAAMLRNRP